MHISMHVYVYVMCLCTHMCIFCGLAYCEFQHQLDITETPRNVPMYGPHTLSHTTSH